MAYEIVMPKMGESIVEGTILEWKKNVGDKIEKDQIILEISTDKVDSEIPSPVEGTILKILYEKGDVVEVGAAIAIVGDSNEVVDNANSLIEENEEKTVSEEVLVEHSQDELVNAPKEQNEPNLDIQNTLNSIDKQANKGRFYSPLVKKISKEKNITFQELDSISGTGLNGRVSKKDVLQYLDDRISQDSDFNEDQSYLASNDDLKEMTHVQKLVAKHMKESVKTSPHVYSNVEVDVTDIVNFVSKNKNQFYEKYGNKLTFTPIFLDACVNALREFPVINSSIQMDKIKHHKNINLGMAVALSDDSLIVPVIHKAEEKNFLGLLRSASDLALKARSGNLSAQDIQGSTFTLTNPGVFGSSFGMAIINQPNVAILSTGSIEKKPVVKETIYGDAVFIRSVMHLTLGYDHRIINGAYGSRFLVSIKEFLENYNLEGKI